MKEFGFAIQEWPFLRFGIVELGWWYIRVFFCSYSILLGWVEWDYSEEEPLTGEE